MSSADQNATVWLYTIFRISYSRRTVHHRTKPRTRQLLRTILRSIVPRGAGGLRSALPNWSSFLKRCIVSLPVWSICVSTKMRVSLTVLCTQYNPRVYRFLYPPECNRGSSKRHTRADSSSQNVLHKTCGSTYTPPPHASLL